MTKAKVTTKGQVTIPKAIRAQLGLQPGDELEFLTDGEGIRIARCMLASPFVRYRGFLKNLAGHDPDQIIEELRGH